MIILSVEHFAPSCILQTDAGAGAGAESCGWELLTWLIKPGYGGTGYGRGTESNPGGTWGEMDIMSGRVLGPAVRTSREGPV